ncbi:MAG: KR domain-containing protein [Deltaproteobacteria bacterium]|jgi:3-oxoacyl-(acyl-carrier-protein) synthase/acyl carrier protein|nr:KR domain-containing protein [Deltaproteobacteria bacterium]
MSTLSPTASSSNSRRGAAPPEPAAVIGLGALFPGGRPGTAGYWSLIRDGRDAVSDVPPDHFLAADYYDPDPKARDKVYCRRGAFIPKVNFSPLKFGITPRDLETIDTTQLLGLFVADQALRDAGYPPETSDHGRTAVIMGVTGALKMVVSLGSRLAHPQLRDALAESGVDLKTAAEVLERFAEKFPPWRESSFPGLLGNVTAGRVASRLNLGGSNLVVDAACASSLAAVGQALLELRSGRADLVVSGGLDTFSDPFMFSCFSKTPALSPTGEVRSFDQAGDGTLLGEGLGVVVLKRLSDAVRDGDRVYASIVGVGGSSDGRGTAVFAPSPAGQKRALEAAYREAGWTPDQVELAEAHGTGTAVGDGVELEALGAHFATFARDGGPGESGREPGPPAGPSGDKPAGPGPWCALGSVKSQIGHTKGAAGAAGLIKAVLSLHHKVLPPTIKVTRPLSPLDDPSFPLYLNDQARPWVSAPGRPRRASVSAFGFGGSNFHCLLEEAGPGKPAAETGCFLVPVSGESEEELRGRLGSLLDLPDERALSVMAAGLVKNFDPGAPARLVLAGPPGEIFAGAAARLAAPADDGGRGSESSESPENPASPAGPTGGAPPGAGLLFPGLDRTNLRPAAAAFAVLASHFPAPAAALDLAEGLRVKKSLSPRNLGLVCSPPRLAHRDYREALSGELRKPALAALVHAAVGCGLADLLRGWSVDAAACAVSGLGVLAGLRWLGRLELEDCLGLAADLAAPGFDFEGPLAEKLRAALRDACGGDSLLADPAGRALSYEDALEELKSFAKSLWSEDAPAGASADAAADDVGDKSRSPGENRGADEGESRPAAARPVVGAPAIVADGGRTELLDLADPLAGLAKTMARLAENGLGFNFAAWPNTPEETSEPAGLVVPVGGANLFVAPAPAPPTPGPAAAAPADDRPLLREILANQRRGLRAIEALEGRLSGAGAVSLSAGSAAAASGAGSSPPGAPARPAGPFRTAASGRGDGAGLTASPGGDGAGLTASPGGDSAGLTASPGGDSAGLTASPGGGRAGTAPADDRPASPGGKGNGRGTGDYVGPVMSEDQAWRALAAVVSRETGYPADALDRDMELENDLGLDSIKKVELLSALGETFPGLSAAASDPGDGLTLGRLLAECLRAARAGRAASPSLSPPASPSPAARGGADPAGPPAGRAGPDLERARRAVFEILSAETGYPEDSLNPEMELENDLGLDSIKKVELLSALGERFPGADTGAMSEAATLGGIILALGAVDPAPEAGRDEDDDFSPPAEAGLVDAGFVMEVVARETGYPVESLDPAMDLEDDLGLDSIKKVEILAQLSEGRAGRADQSLLSRARTLGDWHECLCQAGPAGSRKPAGSGGNGRDPAGAGPARTAGLGRAAAPPAPQASSPAPGGNGRAASAGREILDRMLGRPEGGPSLWQVEPEPFAAAGQGACLWPPAGLVRLVGSDPLSKGLEKELTAGGHQVERRPWRFDFSKWKDDGRKPRVLFLVWPGPDRDPALITQALAALENSGEGLESVVGLSFLGGFFGFPRPGGLPGILGNSVSGALVGLLKCAAREWPGVRVRALDLPLAVYNSPTVSWVSAVLETAAGQGPVELGLPTNDKVYGLSLRPYHPAGPGPTPLSPGDTVVATGGGRGVTAAALLALARLCRPRLVILGRTPLPPPEPEWLGVLRDQREIKEALFKLDKEATPRELESRTRIILASRELAGNLAALSEAGAQVEYVSGDFGDPVHTESAARRLRARHGPIRGFIHGAGVLADHPIVGKNHSDFARVYATKTQLASLLLEAFQPEPLRLMVFFSSSTARFGRQGQGDYAAGNEVLNKTAWEMAALHPDCRVLAVNWGPWAGGMVGETLAGQFKSQGVGLIGLQEGAETFMRLIRTPAGGPAEVLVLGGGTSPELLESRGRGGAPR